jgi:hypothetical protein
MKKFRARDVMECSVAVPMYTPADTREIDLERRLGLGAAEHVAGVGGAQGVSGPTRRPDRARARRSLSQLVLGWAWHAHRHLYRDLLVEG